MGDTEKITAECAAARAADELISDACARVIASQWQCGNASASFSTTGAVTVDPSQLWCEMFTPEYSNGNMSDEDKLAADALGLYLAHHGTRGAVAGWSGLWL